ncbi:TlpA family protein disulfide reductase [Sphingobacterium spiritivorum]|nr:TlpA disulfide reductase family protein [Sphingobacterium spiritivorum]QQS96792.1 TlpA family protein disulfide reductase [Sphingobacterium spiritivorum]
MNKYIVLLILVYGSIFQLDAQESYFTKSGYTFLTIKLSGTYPDSVDISTPYISNPLSQAKPEKFQTINDSTFLLSCYTFGPTIIYFNINGRYISSVLLPNQSDILSIFFKNYIDFEMKYEGCFKEFFDNSYLLPALIKNSFEYRYKSMLKVKGVEAAFKTANDFRDFRLKNVDEMIEKLSVNVKSDQLKMQYKRGIKDFYIYSLIKDYSDLVKLHNMTIGLDSLDILKYIPPRDQSYYDAIIDSRYQDTISLISSDSYFNLLSSIRQDSLLKLPLISTVGIKVYKNLLKNIFGRYFSQDENLFLDMMVANAYIGQINNGLSLSDEDKFNIISFLENRDLVNYILYQNDINVQNYNTVNSKKSGKYYFAFEKSKILVMNDIIAKYKDKVIIVDFWATWCGPCIEAFDKIKGVKKRFADRDDVIFVYLTDETSDYTGWNNYVNLFEGEHYYLYNNQLSLISDTYGVKYIPSYLIFNKRGELSQKSLGGYMGNEKAIEWIENALKE